MTDTLTTTTGEQRLATRMARGAEFLGAEMAIMAGAMSWVSEATSSPPCRTRAASA